MFFKLIEFSRAAIRCNRTGKRFSPDTVGAISERITQILRYFPKECPASVDKLFVKCSHYDSKVIFPIIKKNSLLYLLLNELKNMQSALKHNSVGITKNCLAQFEFVVAQRVRRAQQMFSLYSKLWDEKALRILLSRLRGQIFRKGRAFLLGSSTAVIFNWDSERIQDNELSKHFREMEICQLLKEDLHRKRSTDSKSSLSSISSCITCDVESQNCECWEPFIAKEDLVVWKREAPSKGSGIYSYKMYGRYDDVTAYAFLEAFLDTASRKSWDSHVADLRIIESEPQSNSDIIYWETKWPKLFNNRDYIFNRRYKIFQKEKLMVVANRGSAHPSCPVYPNKTRVSEYWSYMVIKPYTHFDKVGIEFSLTYFDNPGTSLPSALSLWVSSSAMPEYVKKLRLVAKQKSSSTISLTGLTDEGREDAFLAFGGASEEEEKMESLSEESCSEDEEEEDGAREEDEVKEDAEEEEEKEISPEQTSFDFIPWINSVDDSVIFQLLIS